MTLEESKKHLEQFIEQSKKYLLTIEDDHTQYTRTKYVEMCEDVKAIETVLKALEEPEDIYPLTIIKDRYSGAYSHGIYTAWNLDFEEIPEEINSEDTICHGFWLKNNKIIVGKGNTPIEAINNLMELLGE